MRADGMKKHQTLTNSSERKRVLVLIAVTGLLIVIIIARQCSRIDLPVVDPTVSFERKQSNDPGTNGTAVTPLSLPDDGEVYRTADRLREASALALAAALFEANEQSSGRITPDAEAVVSGIRSARLLPPGLTIETRSTLDSDHAKLLLHFRPEPLAIEVLSLPRSREDGPALMIRIPAAGNDPQKGSVFIADRLGRIDPPMPFANITDCVQAGWIDQGFNQADIAAVEKEQLRAWLVAKRH
jgi:hypothetical protein